jgi:hypothetical protein
VDELLASRSLWLMKRIVVIHDTVLTEEDELLSIRTLS